MASYDQLHTTARAWYAAYDTSDLDAITSLSTPYCIFRGGPSSVAPPIRNVDEYIIHVRGVIDSLTEPWQTGLIDLMVDEKERKAVIFGWTKATTEAGMYENEWVILIKMTEDGGKVREQFEFIGSFEMVSFMENVKSWAGDEKQ
jgi:hypothetical protein